MLSARGGEGAGGLQGQGCAKVFSGPWRSSCLPRGACAGGHLGLRTHAGLPGKGWALWAQGLGGVPQPHS